MKIRLLKQLALAGLTACITHTAFAQTWQTVEILHDIGGVESFVIDPADNLYAGGEIIRETSDGGTSWLTLTQDPQHLGSAMSRDVNGVLYADGWEPNIFHGVHRSLDGGLTWSRVDPFGWSLRATAVDSSGNVFAAGPDPSGAWCVRKGTTNPDGSMNWTTVDTNPDNPAGGFPRSVLCHPTAGVLAMSGYYAETYKVKNRSYTRYVWLVRRSLDGGTTWTSFDAAVGGNGDNLGMDSAGNIYAVGQGPNEDWLVRQSSDGGMTWATVDSWKLSKFVGAHARAVASDGAGNLYVVGGGVNMGSGWYVRMRPAGTTTWKLIDNFQGPLSYPPIPYAVAIDSAGHVYVGGTGQDAANNDYRVVRKLSW